MRSAWSGLEDHLRGFAASLPERPRAILVVSGHWEEDRPTVNIGRAPPLLFDHGGFPDYTYALTWPAPGAPELALSVCQLLAQSGLASAADDVRGWDHGVFVPLKVAFPAADVPVLQLSLERGLDPGGHLRIGRALTPLREDGVLIVGSGLSYHNMRGFFGGSGRLDPDAEAFDGWLRQAIRDGAGRESALIAWDKAPGGRSAHPREDHLLPLMVAAGAAPGEPGEVIFHGHAMGKPISGFRFG